MKQLIHLAQIKDLILEIERLSVTNPILQTPYNRGRLRKAKKYLYLAVRDLDMVNQQNCYLKQPLKKKL